MKTIHFLIPLLGAALVAAEAEPAKTNSPATTTELSVEKKSTTDDTQAAMPAMAGEQKIQKSGERVALSGAITKAPPSRARTVGELFNPFAPDETKSETRWLERTAWSTAAITATGSSTPAEMRHESRFGVVVASR